MYVRCCRRSVNDQLNSVQTMQLCSYLFDQMMTGRLAVDSYIEAAESRVVSLIVVTLTDRPHGQRRAETTRVTLTLLRDSLRDGPVDSLRRNAMT